MEIIFVKALQFVLAISLLVLLHEGGHMFFAKLFGIRVEKFYVFFDVSIGKWGGSLFHFKPKNSDTDYGMGWLPLGGYCKIAGMIDESFDTEQMAKPAEPWEFRTKPAWQRLLVMIGGVTVNFFLALFIYSMIMFVWGETYVQMKDMKQGMVFNEEAKSYGFKDHDILVGTEKGQFKDFSADMFRALSKATRVDIIRNGKPKSLSLSGDINLLDMIKSTPAFCRPYRPATVDSVIPGGPGEKLGLKKGNKILALNGVKITSANLFLDELSRFPSVQSLYVATHKSYGFLASFPAGVAYGWDVLKGYVSDMKYIFTADGAKSLGGFGSIGSLFPSSWDWYLFWKMTAFLSIILAFMNILPIPALDGGHVLFLIYEIITGRKPSEKFMIRAEYTGVTILILLMIVANLNDILRWLGYM